MSPSIPPRGERVIVRERHADVTTQMVDALCEPPCDGVMTYTGHARPSAPPGYLHGCKRCGREQWLTRRYPDVRFVEGDEAGSPSASNISSSGEPRSSHAEDLLRRILERLDQMDAKISAALDALAAATDAELAKLGDVETQLRSASSLSDTESTEIADRIGAITAKLKGAVDDTTAAASAPADPAA